MLNSGKAPKTHRYTSNEAFRCSVAVSFNIASTAPKSAGRRSLLNNVESVHS
jgi:hypothetical protein